MNGFNYLTPDLIRQRLAESDSSLSFDLRSDFDWRESRKAAVLIPFYLYQGVWHLLFIRRADHPSDMHSGQVAFAGGKRESQDRDMIETALREAEEEIGLPRDKVEVLGQLSMHHSISRYCITPVVSVIPWPCTLIADRLEVSRIFSIPLDWLATPSHHRLQPHQHHGKKFPVVYFDPYDGEILWGATARMVLSLVAKIQPADTAGSINNPAIL